MQSFVQFINSLVFFASIFDSSNHFFKEINFVSIGILGSNAITSNVIILSLFSTFAYDNLIINSYHIF